MLVKAHIKDYQDDYGWLHEDIGIQNGNTLNFLVRGSMQVTKRMAKHLSKVSHVHWFWLDRDAHVKCNVAATREERVTGLQGYSKLGEYEGLYFPYPGGSDVSFHQGTVPFSLDIIFLKDGEVVNYVENTRVGSTDCWACKDCDGVIEVNAGFVEAHGIDRYDETAFIANSERDLNDFKHEASLTRDQLFGAIADELF